MSNGTIGIAVQEPDAAAALAAIERYDARGVPAAWLTTSGAGPDALTVFAAAAVRTRQILMGTSITPIYPRHPLAVVQQVSVIASLAPGRFRLGVGPSHQPAVETTYGIPFEAPLGHLREYLQVLRPALAEGAVDFDGRFYHAHARLAVPPAPVPLMASALRPNAFRLCGGLADGAITWLCPLPYVRDVALPALREGAQRSGRAAPPLIAHVPFCVSTDAAAVRQAARAQLGGYPRLPYYARMIADSGFPEALQGTWSDAMIDGIVVHGDERAVAAGLRAFLAAGAGELIAAPIVTGDDRQASLDRAAAVLAGLASETTGR